MSTPTPDAIRALADRVTGRDPRAVARAISLIENEAPAAAPLVGQLHPSTGRAYLVGGQPVRGQPRAIQIGLAKAPQHDALTHPRAVTGRVCSRWVRAKPGQDAGREAGCGGAVFLIAARPDDLVHGAERQPAARQDGVDRRRVERQHAVSRRLLEPADMSA